jgi:nicotinate-nucleotide adenylyltransferase
VRRAILGGTFDPPHLAHLVVGEAAFRQLDVDVVTYVPAGAPWQKGGRDVTPARHRWAMTMIATKDVGYFEADDREISRDGWTYTVDTLSEFEGDDLVLVLGADAARGIPTWHQSAEVLDRAEIAVAARPGSDRSSVESAIGSVHWLDTPLLDISGSEIRRRASEGSSIRFLVRDDVWAYTETHALYG